MEETDNLFKIRHSLSHLLAAAVLTHFPHAKPTIGPATDDGFYYDFDFGKHKPSSDDLSLIESTMRSILPTWTSFVRSEISKEEALQLFQGNEYKRELIEDITHKGDAITIYTSGEFTDLCRGGHVDNAQKDIPADSFTLDKIAGAYWRGSEENTMLTRIYGLAFATKQELEAYVYQQEEAKKRDHRKLGKELKLFTISPLIGSGLPLMQPKGMIIRKEIEEYLWKLHKGKGYERVWTPHIGKEDLYVTSGHAAKFGDELFRVSGKEEHFILKPMNCPHHMQIYNDNQFSYRDMPVRYFEPATVYRDEKTGQLSGLTRVRSITQDDGHLFCRVEQIGDEVSTIVNIIKEFYSTFGMMTDYWVRLSVRGEDMSAYLGSNEVWEKAEEALEKAAQSNNLNYKRGEGEAAFYGPKLDFIFKDSIGRELQLATIQCDFNLPERFDLSFINEKGEKERPVVIHRAISGSLERFMGILIEHYAGAFPTWLSPVQIAILPVSTVHESDADSLRALCVEHDIRSEIFYSGDSLGKRLREVKLSKIPYFVVIGDKEIEKGEYTLESRDGTKHLITKNEKRAAHGEITSFISQIISQKK
jgi:threonyl-tRNA synthetase